MKVVLGEAVLDSLADAPPVVRKASAPSFRIRNSPLTALTEKIPPTAQTQKPHRRRLRLAVSA